MPYLHLSSSSTNISSENHQSRLSLLKPCKLTPRYILLALFATIVFIYLAAPRLDFNNQVAYILGNSVFNSRNLTQLIYGGQSIPVATKSTQEQTTTKLDSRCDPIDPKFVQYSVDIDGVKYPQGLPLYKNKSINFECLRENKAKKKILAWNSFFGDWNYAKPFSHGCPVTNCEITGDRKFLSTADMVMIHMRDSINPLPATRPSFQRWVFVLYESPIHSADFTQYNGFFNATSTYRLDSEFSYFYEGSSHMHWTPNATFNEKHDFYASKLKFATAVISNCGASSRRIDYIGEMQKYVEVDVFGHCGKPCPTKYSDSSAGNCKEILGIEYKFYLAFENSICEDYITEKFFYILRHPIIPVVYGGGNYEHYIPKSGFVDAREFESPKHLTDYLMYLDKNRTAYNSYFKWKKHVSFESESNNFPPICDMCVRLNLEDYYGIENNVIANIGEYWSRSRNCKKVQIGANRSFKLDKLK